MNIVVNAVTPLCPGLAAILADVHAPDFNASDDAIGGIRMGAEASDVSLVAVPRCKPVVA
jgi:hypothetical protein